MRLIDADRLKADNPRYMNLDVPYFSEETVSDIIDAAPTADRWISIADGLPEDYETVLATVEVDYGEKEYVVYPEARYSERHGWEWAYEAGCDYWQKLSGVVAWQALPDPYRKE